MKARCRRTWAFARWVRPVGLRGPVLSAVLLDLMRAPGRRPEVQALAYLAYVAFWTIQPCYARDLRQWLYLLAAVIFFIPTFLGVAFGGLRTRRIAMAAQLALGLVYVPINQSAFGIYIYIAWELVEVFPSNRAVLMAMVVECLIIWLQGMIFHLQDWEWTIGIGISSLSVMNSLRLRQQERDSAKLRMAHSEIEQLAKTAERERIARDLHDLLGHTLSLIVIKSELAGKLFAVQPERAQRELCEIEATARRALAEVRETVSGYRSRGLSEELRSAAEALQAAGVRPEVPTAAPRLEPRQEATLALVLREAVTNVVRHADAQSCRVEIASTATSTRLVVVDDGRGGTLREGNGLRGMRERVGELGGSLTLEGSAGTRLEVALPAGAE